MIEEDAFPQENTDVIISAFDAVRARAPFSLHISHTQMCMSLFVVLYSQPTFDPELAIDGDDGSSRGWAYHGKIDQAAIVFAFDNARYIHL